MASGGGNGDGDKNQLKLYSYWRSSCSRRVRIALNLKGLKYENRAINLVKGEQFSPEFSKLNPLGYVPVLVDGDIVLSDSFAIIMYLEEKYPQHPLLPRDLQKRGINYQAACIVSSSIQPLQNLAILKYIEEKVGPNEKISWAEQHIEKGFAALEKLLKDYAGRYATGDEVFMADLFLAPQLDAATKRFNVDMVVNATGPWPSRIRGITEFGNSMTLYILLWPVYTFLLTQFPLLSRLNEAYNEIPAFQDAMPEKQPDAPPACTS